MDFLGEIINKEFNVSFVSYIEFLGYKDVNKASVAFISMANVFEINKSIINTCIELRKTRRINLPDTIIAATALHFNLVVISRNVKDFKGIDGLAVVNPHAI